jgi:hypothetical protein
LPGHSHSPRNYLSFESVEKDRVNQRTLIDPVASEPTERAVHALIVTIGKVPK